MDEFMMELKPEEEALIEAVRRQGEIYLDTRVAQRAVDAAEAVLGGVKARAASAGKDVDRAMNDLVNLGSGDFYCLEHDVFGHYFKGCPTCGAGRDEGKALQVKLLHHA
jgi:hypothetical protein